ncbi:hypothetical protein [Salinimicrobium sp. WS361]|uniref:hypothetical protein n=1 Tax=Salinimicrobium sp. WS361 TaxID=3425123 RepID=UPI003D6EDA7A
MRYYQHRDYLDMIMIGFFYHYDYLVPYLQREQIKAEKDQIEFSEFIGRTITVLKDFRGELYRLRDQKKEELEAKKNGENDKIIEEQINNIQITENVFLPLENYTDGKFPGYLGFWHIDWFGRAIDQAFNFYSIEKEDDDPAKPIQYFLCSESETEDVDEKESKTAPKLNPYPEVFRSLESYLLFQRLYTSNKNSRTLLADFSFIYRRMYQDGLLQDHQTPEVFRRWLANEPFEIVLDNYLKTLDNCNTKDKEDRYDDAKTLVRNQIN